MAEYLNKVAGPLVDELESYRITMASKIKQEVIKAETHFQELFTKENALQAQLGADPNNKIRNKAIQEELVSTKQKKEFVASAHNSLKVLQKELIQDVAEYKETARKSGGYNTTEKKLNQIKEKTNQIFAEAVAITNPAPIIRNDPPPLVKPKSIFRQIADAVIQYTKNFGSGAKVRSEPKVKSTDNIAPNDAQQPPPTSSPVRRVLPTPPTKPQQSEVKNAASKVSGYGKKLPEIPAPKKPAPAADKSIKPPTVPQQPQQAAKAEAYAKHVQKKEPVKYPFGGPPKPPPSQQQMANARKLETEDKLRRSGFQVEDPKAPTIVRPK